MPQIAQQDYLYIRPVNASTVSTDAAALGQLRRAVDNGTIWDCVIKNPFVFDGIAGPNWGRVIGAYTEASRRVTIWDAGNDEAGVISLLHTQLQYEGLAAIQASLKENGNPVDEIPDLGTANGYLGELSYGNYVAVDGHYIIPTITDNKIASLSIGEQISEGDDFINITWEDAQKLIGLPIN
mgnify:CR=1 FL=1